MVNSQMDKNAFKPSKKQMYLIFRGVAFCAKRKYDYLCAVIMVIGYCTLYIINYKLLLK